MNIYPVTKMVFHPPTSEIHEHRSYDAFIRLASGGVILVNDESRLDAISKLLLAVQRDHDKARELATI